jgi:hypothetical protein
VDSGALLGEEHWWRASLQQILTRPDPTVETAQRQTDLLRGVLQTLKTGRDGLDQIADAFVEQAASGAEPMERALAKAEFFRSLKGSLSVVSDQDKVRLVNLRQSGKSVSLPMDRVLIVFQFLSALGDKMALDRERADRLGALLDWADRNGVSLDPTFRSEARTLVRKVGDFQASATDALAETILDWGRDKLTGGINEGIARALAQ